MKSPLDKAIEKRLEEFGEKFVIRLSQEFGPPIETTNAYPSELRDFLSQALRDIIRAYREGTKPDLRIAHCGSSLNYCDMHLSIRLGSEMGCRCKCDICEAIKESHRKSQEWCGEDK